MFWCLACWTTLCHRTGDVIAIVSVDSGSGRQSETEVTTWGLNLWGSMRSIRLN